jgi:hypothetical protein|tara:strand:- start:1467 stop:1655 length:189 start_codon:yes stop_codon:yes gene_type:complete
MSEKPTKTWQKIKVFDTYEEAEALKAELTHEYSDSAIEIKIRRCGPEGTQFKVKMHRPKTNG